jgi:peptidoglycan/LPS O-acetylase OafA/YrhL
MVPSETKTSVLVRPGKTSRVASESRSLPGSVEGSRYRPDIDGLRAIAVGLVVLGHTGLLFRGGFIGVDVFFVISGFLITRLILSGYDEGTLTLKQFWLRRVRRILPAAAVAVGATLLAGMMLLRPRELAALGESAIAQQLCLANIYFWAQGGYFDLPSEHKPLLHTWSLAVEEQFYLIWPLILLLVWRRGRKAVALTIGTLGAASLVASEIVTRSHPSAAFYFMPPRMWELLLGALVLFCPSVRSVLVGLSGLAIILVAAALYTPQTPFPGLAALVPCLGTAMIIAAPVANRLSATGLLATRPVVYVGKASYSIYLWHWPLLVFSKMYLGKDFSFAAQAGVVLASLAIGSLSYEFVETPIRSRRWLPDNRHLVLCCGLVAMLICATACSMYSYLASKYPEVALGRDMPQPPEPSGKDAWLDKYRRLGASGRILGGSSDLGRPPTFVLWGDSHAATISKMVDALARSKGLCGKCLAFAGSTPLLGVWNNARPETTGREIQLEWNHDVVEWIRNNKVKNVIMAARWDHRVPPPFVDVDFTYQGLFPDPRTSWREALIRDSRSSVLSPADAQRVLQEHFHETISAFESSGTRVWFLMQVPVQEDDPFGRLTRGVTQQAYEAQQYEMIRFLKLWTSPALTVIGPGKNWFDSAGYSVIADSEGPYYADRDHLNSRGAQKLLGPLLAPVFDRMKQDGRQPRQRRTL